MLGIPFWYGAIGVVVFTGIYTVIGGMKAVIYTETLQAVVLILGSIIITFLGLQEVGGWAEPKKWNYKSSCCEQNIDLNNEFLFYSRPKGTYKGTDTEKLLLDFYLINTEISADGNKVRATIQDKEFIIDEWAPYYIEGLAKGDVKIKLELIDSSGNLIDTPFNPSERTVTLE